MEEQYLWTIVCAVFVVILVGIAVRDRIQSRKRQINKSFVSDGGRCRSRNIRRKN